MLRKIIILYYVIYAHNLAYNQEILTLETAIRIGVENNLNIKISKNINTINEIRNNIGNASMLPQISLGTSYNSSYINSDQTYNNGTGQKINNANVQNGNISLNLSWTIFDGFKMFEIKKRLFANQNLTILQIKEQIENIIYAIMINYYNIIRITHAIKLNQQNLHLYEERKKIAQLKFEIGTGSKSDLLQSQLDENKIKSSLLQSQLELTSAKTKLNQLLLKSSNEDFIILDTIQNNYNPQLNELKKSSLENNIKIKISKQNENIARINIQESKANYLPTIQLNSGLLYNYTNSQVGLIHLNQQNSANIGIGLNWVLFNGKQNTNQIKERQLLYNNQQQITQNIIQEVDANIYYNYQNYLVNKEVMTLEKSNLDKINELTQITLERYKSGKGTLLETIESYKNLEDIQTRFLTSQYNTKIAEIELIKSNGELIK